jgi:type I restriction enzyme S subunit
MSELPQGWARTTIGSVCDLVNGKAFKPSDWSETGLPIVRIQNLNRPDAKFNHYNEKVEGRFLIENGDLLFAWSGTPGTSFGAHIWNGPQAILNQHIFNVKFDRSEIDRTFLRHAINQTLDEQIAKAHGGVGLRHVTKGKFEETAIALPPLPEQRRIVAKIDSLTGKSRRARDHLDHIPRLVEKYKQAVLAAAFRGDFSDNIQWNEVLFFEALDFKGGSQPPKSTFSRTPGPGLIRLLQIRDFASDEKAIYIRDDRSWPSCTETDIMVGRYGASVGKILSGKAGAYNVALVKMLFDPAKIERDFLYYWLKSDAFQKPLMTVSRSAQNGFNKSDLENVLVPQPAIEIQRLIAGKITRALDWIDRLASEATSARKLIDHLHQSILSKAFRGELVPHDPNDEPASVLLERIRAERGAAPKAKRGRRKQVA